MVNTWSICRETSTLCAETVGKLLDIETIYLRPEVRRFIENSVEPGM